MAGEDNAERFSDESNVCHPRARRPSGEFDVVSGNLCFAAQCGDDTSMATQPSLDGAVLSGFLRIAATGREYRSGDWSRWNDLYGKPRAFRRDGKLRRGGEFESDAEMGGIIAESFERWLRGDYSYRANHRNAERLQTGNKHGSRSDNKRDGLRVDRG